EGESQSYEGYAEIKKTYNDDDTVKETYTSIYDKYGRLRAEKVGDTTLKTYSYDHLDRRISEQGDGVNLTYTYNWNGEVADIIRTVGTDTYTESNTYNGLGQLTSYRDYDGYTGKYNTILYEYDYLGNVIKQKTAFDKNKNTVIYAETLNTYDPNGNLTKVQIKNNTPNAQTSYVETNYTYDNLNRPVTATSGNIVTTYTYDDLGNIATQKTGDSETEYTYNSLGQLVKKTDALGQEETYTYDKNGFLKTMTDRNGTVFTYTYNALGNILTENAIGTDLSVNTRTSTYYKTGELKSVTENGITLEYEYDTNGLLTKVTDNNAGSVQNYTYDDYGKLTAYTLTLDDVQHINTTYGYDTAARLHTVSEDGVTQAIYAYNPDGTIQSETIGNGINTAYTYNPANLVTNVSSKKDNTLLAEYAYAYSLDGNIVEKSDNTGTITSYVYDNAGMLLSETVSNKVKQLQNTQYSYDNRGNRTSVIGTVGDEYTENYAHDLNNRLTDVSKVVYNEYGHPVKTLSTTYNYDNNGNVLSKNTSVTGNSPDNTSSAVNTLGAGTDTQESKTSVAVYNYNLNNQLESVIKNGITSTYTYNPDGYRSSKTVDGVTINHIWNGTQIALETDATDTPIAEYIYGVKRIYNEQNGEKSYYLYDAHGDTKHLT
ncbi:MAG: RHS repeat protein, partial [Clostridia bacterium]|nr:RHS repeat protein [Clostridia bacterium]